MGLRWYLAPVCTDPECTIEGHHPGAAVDCPGIVPAIARIHCYTPEEGPRECFVGCKNDLDIDGWVHVSPTFIRIRFQQIMGREATAEEVY